MKAIQEQIKRKQTEINNNLSDIRVLTEYMPKLIDLAKRAKAHEARWAQIYKNPTQHKRDMATWSRFRKEAGALCVEIRDKLHEDDLLSWMYEDHPEVWKLL